MTFLAYYLDFFDDDAEMFWFARFKALARQRLRLMNADDIDYKALKAICHPDTKDLYRVAWICYEHNETAFREEVMDWIEMVTGGYKRSYDVDSPHFLRPCPARRQSC